MATLNTVLHPKLDKHGSKIFRLGLWSTVNRKRSYYYLGKNINSSDWDSQVEKVKKPHQKFSQLNRLIRKKHGTIEDIVLEMDSFDKTYSAKQIIDLVRNKNTEQPSYPLKKIKPVMDISEAALI